MQRNINLLLTEREGRTGEYRHQVRTKTTDSWEAYPLVRFNIPQYGSSKLG